MSNTGVMDITDKNGQAYKDWAAYNATLPNRGPDNPTVSTEPVQATDPSAPGAEPVPPQPNLQSAINLGDYDTSTPLGKYLQSNPTRRSAYDNVKATLATYGLQGQDISDLIQNSLQQGLSSDEVLNQIRQTPTYKTRFAAIEQRQAAGLPAISEADVINNERSYAQVMQASGMPQGFYDQPEDFTQLIANDVSPTELQDRVMKGYQAMQMSDSPTKQALQSLYGLTDGDMAAYWLDPTRTEQLLMNHFTAAQIAGTASRTGWGNLNRGQAEGLQAQGVTQAQAEQGFNKLGSESQLMQALPGQTGQPNIDQNTQLSAMFGQNAQAQQKIAGVAQQRVATFQGGGSFASNKEGTAGLGQAQ